MTTFRFARAWDVAAPVDDVRRVLLDLERYPEWWPQVRAVARIDDDTMRVLCRSVLPYTLDLVLHAEQRGPEVLRSTITGDLEGWSAFRLGEAGGRTHVAYQQTVVVAHRVLARASRVLEPVLRWNHDQMMRGCERGLAGRVG